MTPRVNDIQAAGAVVFRPGSKGTEVLLVHRPKYDDWSFPKGKLDRGEHVAACAVREVVEETGLSIRLGRPLATQRYRTSRGMKQVHYWIGRVRDDNTAAITDYAPNTEIDEIAWVPVDKASRLLTYSYDRDTLAEALQQPKRTDTLIVLRHGLARARSAWRQDDELRPLLAAGRLQAERLIPILTAYGVQRVITSPSARCVQTVTPYVGDAGAELVLEDLLSEPGVRAKQTAAVIANLDGKLPVVACSHRPVLPVITTALGVDQPPLDKGEMLIIHRRKGVILATERI